jgi:GT2 family glycosyltransferase
MRDNLDLSVIVVSFQTRELTLACLESIQRETRTLRFEVLVVDNASTDGSAEFVRKRFPQMTLIESEVNLGFAGAVNLAARHARGEYLLLLNPDTLVLDRALERLHSFALAHPEFAIYGGRTIFPDGSLNPGSCFARQTPWSLFCSAFGLTALLPRSTFFNPEAYGSWERDSVRTVDAVQGSLLLTRRSFWCEMGGFDASFFMYGEEADFCERARRRGARAVITPDATIVHFGGASDRIRTEKLVNLLSGKRKLIERHWPRRWHGLGRTLLRARVFNRRFAARLMGSIGAQDRAARFETWDEVWRRRADWSG